MDPGEIAASRIPAVSDLGYLYFILLPEPELKIKGNRERIKQGCPVNVGRLYHSGKMGFTAK
jgi:hypothetical protein